MACNRRVPKGGCNCECPGGYCGINKGEYTTARYRIILSDLPASVSYCWTGGADSSFYTDVQVTGLDAFNGTYFVDVPIVDGCPQPTSQTLATGSITYNWEQFGRTINSDVDDECPNEHICFGSDDCDMVLVFDTSGFARVQFGYLDVGSRCPAKDNDGNEDCGVPKGLDWDLGGRHTLLWQDPDDCDKLPDGSESVLGNLRTASEVVPKCKSGGSGCVGIVGNYTMELTAQWS